MWHLSQAANLVAIFTTFPLGLLYLFRSRYLHTCTGLQIRLVERAAAMLLTIGNAWRGVCSSVGKDDYSEILI